MTKKKDDSEKDPDYAAKRREASKGYHQARQREQREKDRHWHERIADPFVWRRERYGPVTRKPDCVVSDPRGNVRVGVWRNYHPGADAKSYNAQLMVSFWSKRSCRLIPKFTLNVREMFIVAKCLHKAVEWCCNDAGVPYPAILFEHAQVGYEVEYGPGQNDRVVVSSEEEVRRVVEGTLESETFDPMQYQMESLESQFEDGEKRNEWDVYHRGKPERNDAGDLVIFEAEDDRSKRRGGDSGLLEVGEPDVDLPGETGTPDDGGE